MVAESSSSSSSHTVTGPICLATVTTDSFVPGTLVMIHSFLKQNTWFKGDILIINNGLKPECYEYLVNSYKKIKFLTCNSLLQSRIDELTEVFPEFATKQARFYSLEIFRLRDYDRVLFCDSDLLFRQSIEELFHLPHHFVACGDGAYYRGAGRISGGDFADEPTLTEKGEQVIYNTFNSGLFLVNRALLTDQHYDELLNLVDSRIYKNSKIRLADQIILNIYFAGQQHLVSGIYNFLLAHRDSIYKCKKISVMDAHVIHFNGPYKPWVADEVLHAGLRDAAFIKASAFWFNSYIECLEQLYLQTKRINSNNIQ